MYNLNRIFISYAREDKEFVDRLAQDLRQRGADVWLDRFDIPSGAPWDDQIESALTECRYLLVVLSPASVESPNVKDEISFALSEQKTIFPILYQDCSIPYRVRRLHYRDFRGDYEEKLSRFLDDLAKFHSGVIGPKPQSKIESVKRRDIPAATSRTVHKKTTRTTERRSCLIIANFEYEDVDLRQLVGPGQDAEALAEVLEDPRIGQFEVKKLVNRSSYEVRQEIEGFFDGRKRDDLLLLYFSGHGMKDEAGRLYFATTDTKRKRLRSTAVSANFVNETMRSSRSRRQVLMLDCCFSGAFAQGMVAKAGAEVNTRDYFEGRGRIVLTASDAMQYAFEADIVEGKSVHSVFTSSLVYGLRTGQADLDHDGCILLDELYDYVYEHVVDETSYQVPQKWEFNVEGDIIVAWTPQRLEPPEEPEPKVELPAIIELPSGDEMPTMMLIPAGPFIMGSGQRQDKKEEQPQHRLYLPDYYMAKTPVTNVQYAAFVAATAHRAPDHWPEGIYPQEIGNHPVVNVSWKDALDYCQWLTAVTGKSFRLPTEAEWEKGARGNEGRIYPWGREWEAQRCNSRESRKKGTTSVDAYPPGASPFGLLDMAGNVWEWCTTKWGKNYPFDVQEDEWSPDYLQGEEYRVLRGGSWNDSAEFVRCTGRGPEQPDRKYDEIGFRVVCVTSS